MGIHVYRTKKSFGVILETWTPERVSSKLPEDQYKNYDLRPDMSYEIADETAKAWNKQKTLKKRTLTKAGFKVIEENMAEDTFLPPKVKERFMQELEEDYSGNDSRLRTIKQHWRASCLMIMALKLKHSELHSRRGEIFKYYEEKLWSADYIKRISTITNKWARFLAKHRNGYYEQIPKIGDRMNRIDEARLSNDDIRLPAKPLTWEFLRNKKSEFETAGLIEHWNFLFVSLFFGLRPSETMSLLKKTKGEALVGPKFKVVFNEKHKIQVLKVFQNKIRKSSHKNPWKTIAIYEPEQIEALEIIRQSNFKKPLNKTLKRIFGVDGYGLYSPRKGFTDLFLERGYSLEDISNFLGHSSLLMTWNHYKDKDSFQLPKRDFYLKKVSGE